MATRILVIEDDPSSLELMGYLLRAFGYTPITVGSGEDGLDSAHQDPPDLILCDIQLPGIDGHQVARQLKGHPILAKIPLVAVTALAMVGDRDKVMASGFDGYVSKPIVPETFVKQVEVFLRSRQRSFPQVAFPEESTTRPPAQPAHRGTILIGTGPMVDPFSIPGSPTNPGVIQTTLERGVLMASILIVDDRPINRQFLTTLLGHKGYRTCEAGDGAEALKAARADPPDLIITDLLMPTMDGFELVRQLRCDPSLAATRVIFYTAKYHVRETRELAQAGNIWRLDKPAEPETILRVVAQALAAPSSFIPLPAGFEREHLHLVTDKLSRAVDQLETSRLRLAALGDLGRLLSQEHDLPTALELCCHGARQLFAAKYALVVMLAEDRQSIRQIRTSGLDADAAARINRTDLDLRPLCRLLDVGSPLRLRGSNETMNATGLLPEVTRPTCLLFVPISADAALLLAEQLGAEEFSLEDERLALMLAAHMSLSCENTKLREAISKRRQPGGSSRR